MWLLSLSIRGCHDDAQDVTSFVVVDVVFAIVVVVVVVVVIVVVVVVVVGLVHLCTHLVDHLFPWDQASLCRADLGTLVLL